MPLPPELVTDLVYANRILYDQGVVDGLGHVSVRNPDNPQSYLLSCNRAPGLVKYEDIVAYDLDSNPLEPTAQRPYLERFIHGEIYRHRSDVMAVVHSHSPSMIPFGITNTELKPVFQIGRAHV